MARYYIDPEKSQVENFLEMLNNANPDAPYRFTPQNVTVGSLTPLTLRGIAYAAESHEVGYERHVEMSRVGGALRVFTVVTGSNNGVGNGTDSRCDLLFDANKMTGTLEVPPAAGSGITNPEYLPNSIHFGNVADTPPRRWSNSQTLARYMLFNTVITDTGVVNADGYHVFTIDADTLGVPDPEVYHVHSDNLYIQLINGDGLNNYSVPITAVSDAGYKSTKVVKFFGRSARNYTGNNFPPYYMEAGESAEAIKDALCREYKIPIPDVSIVGITLPTEEFQGVLTLQVTRGPLFAAAQTANRRFIFQLRPVQKPLEGEILIDELDGFDPIV